MLENRIYSKMFTWLFIGLMTTFVSGYCLSINEELLIKVLSVGIIPIVILEVVIALVLSLRLNKMKPLTTKICYIVYSIITGVTFSTIFVVYKIDTIMLVFLITAVLFGICALIGYTTKADLTKYSVLLFITLLAIFIVSVLNIFIFKSTMLELIISVISIILFMGYIAYDINTVKYLMNSVGEEKAAVFGAFQLYLDFINIFINLIKFFGENDN